jgi:hypothetical protein
MKHFSLNEYSTYCLLRKFNPSAFLLLTFLLDYAFEKDEKIFSQGKYSSDMGLKSKNIFTKSLKLLDTYEIIKIIKQEDDFYSIEIFDCIELEVKNV